MKGDLRDVVEIAAEHFGDAFRVVYVAKLANAVYVLHAFQKKSTTGASVPRRLTALIRQRFLLAMQMDRRSHL